MPKDTISTVIERRSIRRYKPEVIPDKDLAQILEAARQAPSGGNRQPRHFIIVRDSVVKHSVCEAANNQMWMEAADAIVIALGLPEVSQRWFMVDPAISLQNIALAATSLGYGTCWIGAFDEAKIKDIVGVPEGLKVVAMMPIGVPDQSPDPKPRKEIGELFSLDRFGGALAIDGLD
jgi:nitroreductase